MSEFSIFNHFDELDQESKYLVHKAKDAANHAHAPYSKFTVGTALILDDGTVVTGANYENAAYPSSMCAERVALFAAAAQYPERRVLKIAIIAKKKGGKDLVPATSCGPCRQVMLEFEMKQRKPITIVMQAEDNSWVVAPSAQSLLPFSFTRNNLEQTHKK